MIRSRSRGLLGLALALAMASPAALAQTAQFDAPRGDRAGGWLAQSRSEVVGTHGLVATSQPLAAQAGLDILKAGGNAFDAAVAAAAVLNVVEPGSAGIGGDVFMIGWVAKEGRLIALNGAGRAPRAATPEAYARLGLQRIPLRGVHSATVPGAVDGWNEILKRAGTMSFKQVLEPAAQIAEGGFGMTERIHGDWKSAEQALKADPDSAAAYLVQGQAPALYSLVRNPDLGRAFRTLQTGGRDAFYKGPIARAMVAKSRALGGWLTLEDLAQTKATWVTPLSTSYHGYDVYELPPSTQGFATLEMLNILEVCAPKLGLDLEKLGQSSADYWHLLVESKKIAYGDLIKYNGDPDFVDVPVTRLISKAYASSRCADIDMGRAATTAPAADGIGGTVYVTVADQAGNMVSLIYSIYDTFGSGVTVPGYGFVLNDRAALFSLDSASPNVIAPGKRPFHTLLPGFVMKDGEPWMSFGLMGGSQQAQGHAQVLVDIIDLGANLQAASDTARFSHSQQRNTLYLESELYSRMEPALTARGHHVVRWDGTEMGGYQAIARVRPPGPGQGQVYRGASDHRKDGQAVGW